MIETTDPYLYPGTDVLKNLRNIRDLHTLSRFEAEATTRRIVELIHASQPGQFDLSHLRATHRYIFQDVYPWAGQFRTVNISKGGNTFGAAAFIEPALGGLFQELSQESSLQGADREPFARRAGYFLGEVNAVHPFRDGNGRAQREFVRELGLHAGFAIDWSRISRDQMVAASRLSVETGDSSGLADLILTCIA